LVQRKREKTTYILHSAQRRINPQDHPKVCNKVPHRYLSSVISIKINSRFNYFNSEGENNLPVANILFDARNSKLIICNIESASYSFK